VRAEYSSGEIPLDCLGHAIAIDEIYDGIELPPIAVGEDEGDFWSDDDEVY
jgi:hypothetical protein